MIKSKRLNNLKLIKEKKLNKVTTEINTLTLEIKKSNDLKVKLKKIRNNINIEEKYSNSMIIMYKYEFDRKILDQIDICENRIFFLTKELLRAKHKLGQIVSQKKLIEKKIKITFLEEFRIKEEKLIRNTPIFRKS